MAEDIIYDAEFRVNNKKYPVISNSIKVVYGYGESSQIAQSIGNGEVELAHSENLETKIAKISCSFASVSDRIDAIDEFKRNRNNNYVVLNSALANRSDVFKSVALTNDPEVALANEGQMDLEFSGTFQKNK